MQRIARGESAQQVLQEFSYRLSNKLLHPTSLALREAAKAEDLSYFEQLSEDLATIYQKRRKAKQ